MVLGRDDHSSSANALISEQARLHVKVRVESARLVADPERLEVTNASSFRRVVPFNSTVWVINLSHTSASLGSCTILCEEQIVLALVQLVARVRVNLPRDCGSNLQGAFSFGLLHVEASCDVGV